MPPKSQLISNKDLEHWDQMPDIDLGIDISNDWIKLWEDFCRKNKLTVVLPYKDPSSRDEQSANAYIMLINIIRIKNNGWVADWKDGSQNKYFPYFYNDPKSGFAFCATGYDNSRACVAARLCFFDRKTAESTAKEFLPIYKIYMTQN